MIASPEAEPAAGPEEQPRVGPERVLGWEELTDTIDLVLWLGQLLLQHGAHATQVEQTVVQVGRALGCDQLDVLVSPNAVLVTTTEGKDFRTKTRRVTGLHVDMGRIVALNEAARSTLAGELDRFALRARLAAIAEAGSRYPRWLVVLMVGVSCGAFARIFGGDWLGAAVTLAASSVALVVRQELTARKVNAVLVVVLTAFVSSLLSAGAARVLPLAEARASVVAGVLLLVPGVALINSVDDLARGHVVIAIVRGFHGVIVSLAIAVGLLLGLALAGSPVL